MRLPSFLSKTVDLACVSDKCKVCFRTTNARNVKAQCNYCQANVHASCINMTEDDLKFLQLQNEVWRCDDCKQNKRDSLRLESAMKAQIASDEHVIKLRAES